MAIYKALPDKMDGLKPEITSSIAGLIINISVRKEIPTINTIETINTSIILIPLFIKKSKRKVSRMVIEIPQIKGKPNKRFKPMAIPMISAKSQAIMAICAKTYKG